MSRQTADHSPLGFLLHLGGLQKLKSQWKGQTAGWAVAGLLRHIVKIYVKKSFFDVVFEFQKSQDISEGIGIFF